MCYMFTVYLSNSLEKLKDELVLFLQNNPPASPLSREIIVVQSHGMQKWLSLKLSEKLSSWASFSYLFPNSFLDEIFNAALGKQKNISHDPFSRAHLSWLLMEALAHITQNPSEEFDDLIKYLENDIYGLKRWQLASRIAYTFDQYLTFRPDYISAWEEEHSGAERKIFSDDPDFIKHWKWQGKLWRSIKKRINAKHRVERFQDLCSAIQKEHFPKSTNLPSRAIVFGIPMLPPLHLDILSAISSTTDIHMFILHPTNTHLFACKPGEKKKNSKTKKADEIHNPLLASLGKAGTGFLQELHNKTEICFKEIFVDAVDENRSLLRKMQRDIFFDGIAELHDAALPDQSFCIASCHSPMREVEVLRDHILDLLNAPNAPQLDEIIVMTPDIELYAPYIDAVFSSADPVIPYTIADRSPKTENIIITAFFSLLDMVTSRFEASAVLDLLEKKPLQKRLNINDDDLAVIRKWITDTRIRWGFDAQHKESLGLPKTSENTWKAALDRMFLGFAMPESIFFEKSFPYSEIEGSSADLLGKFSRFIHDLRDFMLELSKVHPLSAWQKILTEWAMRFIDPSYESNSQFYLIEEALATLSSLSETTGFSQPVHFSVVRAYLDSILSESSSAKNFLNGSLTFCAMLPMRSIPFKVICLIGMNDGIFPRQDGTIAFDLMAKLPRPGDRSLRNEDRYLFLEALISAKEKMYISYTGQSIVDSSEIPPSVVVSELIDYLKEYLHEKDFNAIFLKHPLQPFSKRYFTGENFFSYSKENLKTAQTLLQSSRKDAPLFFEGRISEPEFKDLSLFELESFLTNPAKYFLQRGLGLRFRKEESGTEDDEPFFVDTLSGYSIKSMLLEDMMEKSTTSEPDIQTFEKYRSLGLLPHGNIGPVAFKNLHKTTSSFFNKAAEFLSEKVIPPLYLELKLPDIEIFLRGTLNQVRETHQTIIRPATIRAKDILKGWIYHLALCSFEDETLPKKTVIVGNASSQKQIDDIIVFRPINCADAIRYLSSLARLAIEHEVELFHFIPECSLAFYTEYNSKDNIDAAIRAAKSKWSSDYKNAYYESDDPYQNLCFGNMDNDQRFGKLFQKNAIDIFSLILESMEQATK